MMDLVEIRLATDDDLDAVLALWEAAEALSSATDDLVSLSRVARAGCLLVAEGEQGEIIGTLIAAFVGWRGNMYRLAVVAEHRKLGIASALVRAAESKLADQGCRRITALVAAQERQATAFWEAVGYRHDDRMARYVRNIASPPAL